MAVEAQRTRLPWPRTRRARRAFTGYMFISPFILGFLLFFVGPALVAAWLTMFDWNMIRPPFFIGLGNFRKMFADDLFYQSLKVTAYFSLVSVPVGLC